MTVKCLDSRLDCSTGFLFQSVSNGGSLTSRRARKVLRHLLDKLATVDDELSTLDHLTDIYSSQRTPIRFPSVLSQFR